MPSKNPNLSQPETASIKSPKKTQQGTACSFLLFAFARKLSFCLFFRTWPREEQGGGQASMLCYSHTVQRSFLRGPASASLCEMPAALLQVEGFPIHLSHRATRTLLSERGVLCGPALYLVAPAFCFMQPSCSLLMFLSMVACR